MDTSDRLKVISFNPRICKRCDPTNKSPEYGVQVSIHASVKDATASYTAAFASLKFQSTHL